MNPRALLLIVALVVLIDSCYRSPKPKDTEIHPYIPGSITADRITVVTIDGSKVCYSEARGFYSCEEK